MKKMKAQANGDILSEDLTFLCTVFIDSLSKTSNQYL